jgi:hypothetical protein
LQTDEKDLEIDLSPWDDKLHGDLQSIGFDLMSHGESRTADWTPSPSDKDWLPIDEVLKQLAERTRAPKLDAGPAEYGAGKKAYRDAGLYGMARMYLGMAYVTAALQCSDWHTMRIEKAGEFLNGVAELKLALLKVTKLNGMNRIGFSAFADGLPPEEKNERLAISCSAEWHLISAVKDLTTMEGWAWEEYEDLSPIEGGRPRVGWRYEFVASLAQFWLMITRRRPSSSPDGMFAEYVAAAWACGNLEPHDLNWHHTIRTVLSQKNDETG